MANRPVEQPATPMVHPPALARPSTVMQRTRGHHGQEICDTSYMLQPVLVGIARFGFRCHGQSVILKNNAVKVAGRARSDDAGTEPLENVGSASMSLLFALTGGRRSARSWRVYSTGANKLPLGARIHQDMMPTNPRMLQMRC